MDYKVSNTGLSTAQIDNSYFEYSETKKYASGQALNVVILGMEPGNCGTLSLYISGKETSLRQVFWRNQEYWNAVYAGYPPQAMHSLSVYRKPMESVEGYSGRQLHVLLVKYEGCRSLRNPNALPLEQFCVREFFGPLVVALSQLESPYSLASFRLYDLQILANLNTLRGYSKPAPLPLPSSPAAPTSQPRGPAFVTKDFALLEKCHHEMSKERFYIFRYKTSYCPRQHVKHEWSTCLYAHWIYDYRRAPDLHYYIPEICPLVAPDRGGVCQAGDKCTYSHSQLEKLYHPARYKVFPCENTRRGVPCTRRDFCAFYHNESERRNPDTLKVDSLAEKNFCQPHPRVPFTAVATNYFDVVTPMTTGKDLEQTLQWVSLELVQTEEESKDKDWASDSGPERKPLKRTIGSSPDHSQDLFAAFSSNNKKTTAGMLSSHATTHASEEGGLKIFIDDQYIDSSDALESADNLDNDPKLAHICASFHSNGSAGATCNLSQS